MEELSKHRQTDDCWIGIDGNVYDVSEFLNLHPGGLDKIFRYAGNDASKGFKMQHPKEYIEKFISQQYIGRLEKVKREKKAIKRVTAVSMVNSVEKFQKPPLSNIFSLDDFKYVESMVYGWKRELGVSKMALCRVFFRPRCLVDVSDVDLRLNIWDLKLEHPFVVNLKQMGNVKIISLNDVNLNVPGCERTIVDGIVGEKELNHLYNKGYDGAILVEREGCVSPVEVLERFQGDPKFAVFIRDGITRGSDVVKILSLGGVPLVDESLRATAIYGEEGFQKGISILHKEVETTMKLVGARSVNELNPTFLELSSLKASFNIDYKRFKEENERYTPLKFPDFKV